MRLVVDRGRIPLLIAMVSAVGVGCTAERRVSTTTVVIPNRLMNPVTIAVAPAINQSGSADFDPDRFADRMASELSYADGVSVIPVSRVLAVLLSDGVEQVASPTHALEVARTIGADAILVFSVTDYDPYDPPRIGISAQLYGRGTGAGVGSVDPVALSRAGRMSASPPRPAGRHRRLLAETQQVFDASHGSVIADIKRYAALRGADESPFGWRRYVVSQQGFIQYCCHATIQELLNGQHEAVLP